MNILNKLTIKHLKMNKKRTIVTIIGIILSTALMVGIGLLLSTFRENAIDSIKMNTGDYHTAFYNVDQKQYETVKNNKDIKKVLLTEKIGYSYLDVNTTEDLTYLIKVLETNKEYLSHIELTSGRMPKNDKEIIIDDNIYTYHVGDKITLNIGTRYDGSQEIFDNEGALEESIINTTAKEYEIVGVFEDDSYFGYSDSGSPVYTLGNDFNKNINVYVKYKNPKSAYDITDTIAKDLGLDKQNQVKINQELLALYGSSRYDNFMNTITGTLTIVLVILSIGCVIVIYNSFAISVIERKKQFGLLSSIGATKKQIRKTVLFEATAVGTIGIILGIGSAYLGIGIVIAIINNLLPDVFETPLRLATYQMFIVIPIIFMIITVFISAFIPAYKASKITPIKAIRLNDDIKIKGKKVKTPKWIRKVFGMEGEIALKNIKRNKKKYRITILSLFISIVLFISFSGYMKYMFYGVDSYSNIPNYDGGVTINVPSEEFNSEKVISFTKDVLKNKSVKTGIFMNEYQLRTKTILNKENYSSKLYELTKNSNRDEDEEPLLTVFEVTPEEFKQLLKSIDETEVKPILYNTRKLVKYGNNTRKMYEISKYSKNLPDSFEMCEYRYDENGETTVCEHQITDYYVGSPKIYSEDYLKDFAGPVFIVPTNYYNYLKEYNNENTSYIFLKINNDEALKTSLEDISSKYAVDYDYVNVAEQYQLIRNLVFCIKLLIYGFIALVTLIGVTSVFNTINTSIHLRRKEFAVLRSMGLSNHGFNKMLFFESIFFCLKSLLYALPVSMGVIVLLHQSFKSMVESDLYIIPYGSIIAAIIGVFVIIMITTIYSTRKIRHENILEAIREENI